MAFANTVLSKNPDLPAGEVIKSSPHNVSAFEVFEDGLVEGRFCKFASGSIDNLDGDAAPKIAGIVRRKPTGEVNAVGTPGVYRTSGQEIDQVAEVINFGFATVTVRNNANPSKYEAVRVHYAADADAGKATNQLESNTVAVSDVVFWEQKAENVWLVRINQYL